MRRAALCAVLLLVPRLAAADPVALESGWVAAPWSFIPSQAFSIGSPDVDGAGNLYVSSSDGIYQVEPTHAGRTLWSGAVGLGLTMNASGEGYTSTRQLTATTTIYHVDSDGSYSPLTSSTDHAYTYGALAPSGTLYFNVWAGANTGLYTIDRLSGLATPLWTGGPAANHVDGVYGDMVVLADDTLYTAGDDGTNQGIFKWTGVGWTLVVPLAGISFGICAGPSGTIFAAISHDVWRVDPVAKTSTMIATGFGNIQGVAYDSVHDRVYVADALHQQVWLINHEGIPARATSWGAVKDRYRH